MKDDDKTVTHTVIPAFPGWCVSILDEGLADLSDEPIIAWHVELEIDNDRDRRHDWRVVTPITADADVDHLHNQWAIKQPDGKYCVPHDRSFDNAEDTIRYLIECKRKDEELRAAIKTKKEQRRVQSETT
jgi:hypothetical protein